MQEKLKYRFDVFELDLAVKRLTRHGKAIAVRPKTMALLEYLLLHRDRVVSKTELLREIWRNTAVEDQAVFQSVSELRSIFGTLRCIETHRGFGYRWIVPVKDNATGPGVRPRLAVAAMAASILFAALLFALPEPQPSNALVIQPVTAHGLSAGQQRLTAGFDHLLANQLQLRGWDAEASDGIRKGNSELQIEVNNAGSGLRFRFTLTSPQRTTSGTVWSPSPLAAAADVAFELHTVLTANSYAADSVLMPGEAIQQARRHMRSGRYETAEAYLTVLTEEQPDNLNARMSLATARRHLGRYSDAARIAHSVYASAVHPSSVLDRMTSAMFLSRHEASSGNLDLAEAFGEEALRIATHVDDPVIIAQAREQLGEVALTRGDLAPGRRQLTSALQAFRDFCPDAGRRIERRLLELEKET